MEEHPKITYGKAITKALERHNIQRYGASGFIAAGVLFDDRDDPEDNARRAIAHILVREVLAKEAAAWNSAGLDKV